MAMLYASPTGIGTSGTPSSCAKIWPTRPASRSTAATARKCAGREPAAHGEQQLGDVAAAQPAKIANGTSGRVLDSGANSMVVVEEKK
ncbi:hypothetical protein ACFYNO_22885 [Kitasatospora sp. NPDC006697]|uniref:hypothetical protein n=1 Tax=Kitasatospora sp. NPDC006697 TaxID=3364020 RepID=UPI0036B274DA